MFHLTCKIPKKINLAFSGGIDSLSAAIFLKNGRRDVTLLHFNHGNSYSNDMEMQCREVARKLDMPIQVGTLINEMPKGMSKEDYWRRERYSFLRSFDEQFITCHHLTDAVETWVWSSLHGDGKLIPIKDELVLRPFLMTTKEQLANFYYNNDKLTINDIVLDPSNNDTSYMRNYMRKYIMPHITNVNPGINTVIRKKYLNLIKESK